MVACEDLVGAFVDDDGFVLAVMVEAVGDGVDVAASCVGGVGFDAGEGDGFGGGEADVGFHGVSLRSVVW